MYYNNLTTCWVISGFLVVRISSGEEDRCQPAEEDRGRSNTNSQHLDGH